MGTGSIHFVQRIADAVDLRTSVAGAGQSVGMRNGHSAAGCSVVGDWEERGVSAFVEGMALVLVVVAGMVASVGS